MGSLGAMKARGSRRTATSRATSRTSTSSCPRASRAASRTRARSRTSSTSSSAGCGRRWATAAPRRSRSCKRGALRPHHRRGPAREPPARRHDHQGSAELPALRLQPSRSGGRERSEERPVLVVDLGGQYSQLIARRVREAASTPSSSATTSSAAEVRRAQPGRARPLGRARLGLRRGRAARRRRALRPRRPDARHLLRHAADGAASSAAASTAPASRSSARPTLHAEREPRCSHGLPGGADGLDEPPRLGRRAARGRARRRRLAGRRRSPPSRIPSARLYGVQFHPEVVHTPHGSDVLQNFLYGVAGAPPAWTPAAVIEEQVERIRAQVGDEPRALRALRRRRLGGRGAARPQGGRRPAHVRLRRPRAAARRRGRAGRRDVRRPLPRPARARRRAGALPRRASRRRATPRRSGKRIGEEFIRVFEEEAAPARATCAFLVQGTLYSDVIESGGTDGVAATDQVAPQRRRAAGGHGDGARRAAAAALQGRGAASRRGARAARARWSGASRFPGPGSRSGSSARSPRSGSRSCARPTRSCRRRSARAGLTASSGSRSPCSRAIRSVGVQGDERTYALPDRRSARSRARTR